MPLPLLICLSLCPADLGHFEDIGCEIEDDCILNLEIEEDEPVLESCLEDFTEFAEAQRETGGRILVHDQFNDRAPLVCIGYLVKAHGYSLLAAVKTVWTAHPCIFENPDQEQLQTLVDIARDAGKLH